MKGKSVKFEAIGTRWDIHVGVPVSVSEWERLLNDIALRIQEFDSAYSRFKSDSLVSRMAKKGGTYTLPEDGQKMLAFYERLYRATNGKVTPLIGSLLEEAGYDKDYSFEARKLHRPPKWTDVITFNDKQITLKHGALLDFGAAGKGYLVDIIGELIEDSGIGSYHINAGGDIRHRSQNDTQLDVGLENPFDNSEAVGVVGLFNNSLCASAGSKRSWGRFTHIIDPVELSSPTFIAATWVMAEDTMTADGLASALFFAKPPALRKFFDFSYAILLKDMSLYHSDNFPVKVFKA